MQVFYSIILLGIVIIQLKKIIRAAHSGISNFHFLILGYSRFSFTEMLQPRCSVWWQLQSTGKSENAF